LIKKDFDMPVKKGKMSKKSAKEIINPDIKRIKIFCINIRPGRPINNTSTLLVYILMLFLGFIEQEITSHI
jgi:hypothetical protein